MLGGRAALFIGYHKAVERKGKGPWIPGASVLYKKYYHKSIVTNHRLHSSIFYTGSELGLNPQRLSEELPLFLQRQPA
jgi:hypothetical protein